ncbi:NACHT domain-containing protein [Burkholderia cenocepacia]|uniref:NACHT domain-containing protein n=1 Tax=Burkholderia cenocepacia TaxID=95486 RepID=UPI000F5876E5|nr:NACHT domain-containing protein [Burkholderia cenocepacia]RQU40853.1 NACHT domain-containing protein [Burkholderia cenocepacia]RQU70282.1 NACHT domain-containing protein [Burkholderia cenocepacia]
MSAQNNELPVNWGDVIPHEWSLGAVIKSSGNAVSILTGSATPMVSKIFVGILLVGICLYAFQWLLGMLVKTTEWVDKLSERWGIYLVERRPVRRSRHAFCDAIRHHIGNLDGLEAWSDRHFAELEAEVQAEGRSYGSVVARLLRMPTSTVRKESRLIDAIKNSAETRILLIGEPGSGKSVAMRHLATQLAIRARHARRSYQIPLYVNLRELTNIPPDGPTPEFIAKFVQENAIRGMWTDSYIMRHWDKYIEEGKWFFLLDSFDEIPAVMHAGAKSKIIDQYADAIRGFLEGMSHCRAVVASREYKAPRFFWERFKVLTLSAERQEQLINRSLIESRDSRELVRKYIAAADSPVFKNPMFLTLLCEDIEREKRLPESEFDLLNRHLENLIDIGADRFGERLSVTEAELSRVAKGMARALALHDELGLAPTFNQLSRCLCTQFLNSDRLRQILDALEYIKILRSDVAQPKSGEKRFTFAHRRYQEAFVVSQLASGELPVPALTLLEDDRWREYVVTFLQSQREEVIQPVLNEAVRLLGERVTYVRYVRDKFGVADVGYFEFEGSSLFSLLSLLQEGLQNRYDIRPQNLTEAVSQVLTEFWSQGDLMNQYTALNTSGLAAPAVLEARIRSVIGEPSGVIQQEAFTKLSYLREMSLDLASWLRNTLANRLIEARGLSDLWRLEAAVARLSSKMGADIVRERCLRLRRPVTLVSFLVRPLARAYQFVMRTAQSVIFRKSDVVEVEFDTDRTLNRGIFKLVMFLLFVSTSSLTLAFTIVYFEQGRLTSGTGALLLVLAWTYLVRSCISFWFRDAGVRLGPKELMRRAVDWNRVHWKGYPQVIASLLKWAVISTLPIATGLYFLYLTGAPVLTVFVLIYALLAALGGVLWLVSLVTKRRSLSRFRILLEAANTNGGDCSGLLLQAKNLREVRWWLEVAREELLHDEHTRRSFIGWLLRPSTREGWTQRPTIEGLRRFAWSETELAIRAARLARYDE